MNNKIQEIESVEVQIQDFKEVYITASYYNGLDPYIISHCDLKSAERFKTENKEVKIFKIKVPYKMEK